MGVILNEIALLAQLGHTSGQENLISSIFHKNEKSKAMSHVCEGLFPKLEASVAQPLPTSTRPNIVLCVRA